MPKYFELQAPLRVEMRHPKPFPANKFTPPPPAAETGVRTAGFIFYTYDTGNPTNFTCSTMAASPHRRGWRYDDVWRPFFLSRGLRIGTGPSMDIDENDGDPLGPVHVWEYSTSGGSVVPEGTPGSTKWVQLRGIGILHTASALHYFWGGHGIPAQHIAQIKAWSTVGTKVGHGLLNFESINQAHAFSPRLEGLLTTSRPHVLAAASTVCTAPNLNAYGCTVIDKYEHSIASDFVSGQNTCSPVYSTSGGTRISCPHTPAHAGLAQYATYGSTKHTYECDVRSNSYIQQLVVYLITQFEAQWAAGYDIQLWDNALDQPYDGSAKNTYPVAYDATAYRGARHSLIGNRTGWKGFCQCLQEIYATKPADFLWYNASAYITAYDALDIRNRFVEFFFLSETGNGQLSPLTALKTRIDVAKDGGMLYCLNAQADSNDRVWGSSAGPGGLNGTWAELMAYADQRDALNNLVVMVARDSNYLFWQEGLAPLV